MAFRHMSKAILRSPLAAETFRAHSSMALGSISGSVVESGSRDCNLVDDFDDIFSSVRVKAESFGFDILPFKTWKEAIREIQ